MSDTPRTDKESTYIDEYESYAVEVSISAWLERSRRDNIKKRWEMRRVMRSRKVFAIGFRDGNFETSFSCYEIYLQGLKK